ncbi:FAD-dependent oxidoreductase [Mailhella massiliensis]|uniref:FAD-dependent oxidoreductase n=1 Tax=Mailhella massiliensis TaxID=1903261 RepID=A0A921DSM7_9BACT|nr:FAD-dependent oxidoreductase [Mailhella massiliensis]HJD98316.1 FAD-dependent oxidoreductase [Mailhella massiliensis]
MPPVFSKPLIHPVLQGNVFSRQHRTSPCELRCPAGNPIQKLHECVEKGEFSEALRWLRARNPFPGVTGRVCPHPCEGVCNRAEYDEPIAIHSLERLAADRGGRGAFLPAPATGKSVGIIGGGPAGLTCAWFCALSGHSVTVYEAAPVAGGIPRQGIPDFRLPKDVVDREVAAVMELGVRIHTNVRVGQDISWKELRSRHHACVIAAGAWKERILNIPGKEYLRPALSFLKEAELSREPLEGKKVLILGGGGVALDCAFTARRLKAESVALLCLEKEDALHAPAEEIEQAREERIALLGSRLAQGIEKDEEGYLVGSVPVRSFSFSESGALEVDAEATPLPPVRADIVIAASGLMPAFTFLDEDAPEKTPRGFIQAGEYGESSQPGVFAAGDAAIGPSTVAEAIGSGRRCAVGIHSFLMEMKEIPDAFIDACGQVAFAEASAQAKAAHKVVFGEIYNVVYHEHGPRVKSRQGGTSLPFAEIDEGFSEEEGVRESARCLHCGHCSHCGSCVEACPGHILTLTDDGPVVSYPDECWHCGCCRLACSTGSISYEFPLNMLV